MTKFRSLAVAATSLSLLVGGGVAEARTPVKSPTLAKVYKHTERADRALEALKSAAARHDASDALAALRAERRQVRSASNAVRRLVRAARSSRKSAANAATGAAVVAAQQNQELAIFADLLDETTGHVQMAIAEAVKAVLAGRDIALDRLNDVIARLPEPARTQATQALEQLMAAAGPLAGLLAENLQSSAVPTDVKSIVMDALGMIETMLTGQIEQLKQTILPLLPAPAQAVVALALDQVTAILGNVTALVNGVLSITPGVGTGSIPGLGDLLGSLPGLSGGIPNISGILGSFFPSR
jgi:hypothetical protein